MAAVRGARAARARPPPRVVVHRRRRSRCWTAGDALWIVAPDDRRRLARPTCSTCCSTRSAAPAWRCSLAHGRERVARACGSTGCSAALTVAALVVALAFGPIVDAPTATPRRSPSTSPIRSATSCWSASCCGVRDAGVAPGPRLGAVRLRRSRLSAVADTALRLPGRGRQLHATARSLDALWPAACSCCGWAAWQPWRPAPRWPPLRPPDVRLPERLRVARARRCSSTTTSCRVSTARRCWRRPRSSSRSCAPGSRFRENAPLLRSTRDEALTDGLTGLPNRRRLMLDLERARRAGRPRPRRPATFAFFDLDGFKGYNDTFGHAAGDMLLDRLASRLARGRRGPRPRLPPRRRRVLRAARRPSTRRRPALVAVRRRRSRSRARASASAPPAARSTIPDEADNADARAAARRPAHVRRQGRRARRRAARRRATCCCRCCASASPTCTSTCDGVAALAAARRRAPRR